MSQRFFVEHPIEDDHADVTGQEAQHLIKVMRAQAGDVVTLFDGSGREFAARVASVGRTEAHFVILEAREVDRELPFRLTLAVAIPKGDRQRVLVEKLTELGVTSLVPLKTIRGVAQPEPQAIARLRRSVIEASKQCGRNRLMEISEPVDSQQLFAATPGNFVRLIAHPGGDSPPRDTTITGDSIVIAVGPEGGFTDEEIRSAFTNGWKGISLGPRILRVETAAIASAVLASANQASGGR